MLAAAAKSKKLDPRKVIDQVSGFLNSFAKKYNFQVAPTQKSGRPSKTNPSVREFRLQLINTTKDTSASFTNAVVGELKSNSSVKKVTYNQLSPNSSKYPSVSFIFEGMAFDAVIAKGANKGENFEKKTISDLQRYFTGKGVKGEYKVLVEKLTKSNPAFGVNEIKSVEQRRGSTKKEGVDIGALGAVIGDIVITDSRKQAWYISLKDVNGATFSSYSGAASLFNDAGLLMPDSAGAVFLRSFGVDLNEVQKGFDKRNNKRTLRQTIPYVSANKEEMKNIFRRAWGMNYFYVRRVAGTDWKVFWIDSAKLNSLTSNMTVTKINYPGPASKQITIYCSNAAAEYVIELRNSKAGEYPNDTKFKIVKLK